MEQLKHSPYSREGLPFLCPRRRGQKPPAVDLQAELCGRNTLPLRGINNFDVSKRFPIEGSKAVEFRAVFYNALNHPQYTPGALSSGRAVSSNITRNNLISGHPLFDRPDQVYDSHAREIPFVPAVHVLALSSRSVSPNPHGEFLGYYRLGGWRNHDLPRQ